MAEAAGAEKIAVIYEQGAEPPDITVSRPQNGVQTICADGVAVAVVARAKGPELTRQDVLLVERMAGARH